MKHSPFVWITGQTEVLKYRIVQEDDDQLILMPLVRSYQEDRITLYREDDQQDNQWKVQGLEDQPFRIFREIFNDRPVLSSDPPQPHQILVGQSFDGRSRDINFWKVSSTTPAGNCRLQRLGFEKYRYQADPGNVINLLYPNPDLELDEHLTTTKAKQGELRINKKGQTFRLVYFNPDQAYLSEWLSD